MSDLSQARRILHVHPAHRTVGVSGVVSPFPLGYRRETASPAKPAEFPLRVSLVLFADDGQSSAALAAFARILNGRGIACPRVDLPGVALAALADLSHVVLFGRGMQVIGHRSQFDADIACGAVGRPSEGFSAEAEITPASRWHPIIDGVGPFVARQTASRCSDLPPEATPLLVRRSATGVLPVAWARQSGGRAFYTLLGHPDDFRRRDFAQLLLSAIRWAHCGA